MSLLRLLLALHLSAAAAAQQWGPWSVIGPFEHPQGAADIVAVTPVERELKFLDVDGHGLNLARGHDGKGAPDLAWRELPGSAGKLDIGPILLADQLSPPPGVAGWSDNAVAYLYRTVVSPRPMELAVRMGSDDGMRCWLNGELLVDRAVPRGLNVSDHSLVLHLREGTNHLLVKVANGAGQWAFQVSGWSKIPQAAIDQAIDRGVQMLLRHQLLDGSWPGQAGYGDGLTAYSGYCLLKSGLGRSHPAVQRARAFVLANPAPYTYSASCELLFLCALSEPDLRPEIEDRLEILLDWQEGSGLWAYPIHPGGTVLPHDLSNTLYVALALRACEEVGVDVSKRAWTRLLEGTLRCFEGMDARAPVTGPGAGPAAGFAYRPQGQPTGSMTTAGVSVIEICRQGLGGSLPGKYRSEALRARRAGLAWLANHMNWGENPGQGGAHHYFFIYGMERVGSILGLEHVGGLNWYWDGAQWLVRAQGGAGGWSGDENFVDTILALLFLRRASAPSTGEKPVKPVDRWGTDDPAARVQLAASGGLKTSIWVYGYSDDVRERLEFPGEEGRGPRVDSVRYFARPRGQGDYVEIGLVRGDSDRPATGERYALQHPFSRAGEWEVYAELEVREPPEAAGLVAGRTDLVSPTLVIAVADALDPGQLDYAAQRTRNRLYGLQVTATASSQAGDQGPGKVADGGHDTPWLSDPKDENPWVRIGVTRPVRCNRVLLSHAQPRQSRAGAAQAERVEVVLNGKEVFEVMMDPDPMRKTVLDLGADLRVRQLELRVLSARNGALGRSAVGFAEVELLRIR